MLMALYVLAGIGLLIAMFVVGQQALHYRMMSKKIVPVFLFTVCCIVALYSWAGWLFFS